MIACTSCGNNTVVIETRGSVRRRACVVVDCNTKFTTVELVKGISLEDAAREMRRAK